jgi:putative ABC transport system permease protein
MMFKPLTKRLAAIGRRNVTRNWRHSLASSLAILAGFSAVSLFDGFLLDLQRVNDEGYSKRGMQGHLLIQRKDAQYKLIEDSFAYSMTKSEQDAVEDILHADRDFDLRVRMLEVKGMVANGMNNAIFIGMAYDVTEGLNMRTDLWGWNTVAGIPFHETTDQNAILVGTGMGKIMDCVPLVDIYRVMKRAGGYIPENRPFACQRPSLQVSASTEAAQVNALDLKVIGIVDGGFREQDKHWVTMPLSVAQKLLDTDKITTMNVRLKPKADVVAFIQRFQTVAKARGLNLDVIPWQEHSVGAVMRGSMQILNTFRNLFMVIVVTICVLSVSNTMMKSVSERIREIGALRSFGFKRQDISRMFMFEGLFLSLFSCFAGAVLTLLLSFAINYSGITYKAGLLSAPIYLTVGVNPMVWVINTVWLTSLAAGTAWFAARRAARMVIADAMRHV